MAQVPDHEQDVRGLQPGLRDDRVVSGDEGLRNRGGLLLVGPIRHRDHVTLGHDHALGETAAADEPEDAVADLPVPDRLAGGHHAARDLWARNLGGRRGGAGSPRAARGRPDSPRRR
jgi:hypothetical protein